MNTLYYWQNKFEAILSNHPSIQRDASHDLYHFKRVWALAQRFCDEVMHEQQDEPCDTLIVLAGCYFHDIVNHPKNSPLRSQSSKDAAIEASKILLHMNFPADKIPGVSHCIEAHSYSAGIKPQTIEAKIVQDADRMEALGAIGLARTFYTAGLMVSNMFSSQDPFAENRPLDESKYSVDHFFTKLLKLADTMQTAPGKKEALKRQKVLTQFLKDLAYELQIQ